MNFKYKFIKNKKFSCPSCGKKTFSKFEGLPEHFGRCDRENNCGYEHLPTRQNLTEEGLQNFEPKPMEEKPIIWLMPNAYDAVNFSKNKHLSNFRKFCKEKLNISEGHLDLWNVGADNKGRDVFMFLNQKGEYCNHKIGKYDLKTCKRNKDFGFFSIKQKSPYEKYSLPLFGEWQFKEHNKDIPVCVVESEKTAIICSFFYPELLWVSCGSASGLSDGTAGSNDRLTPLQDRIVWWICDADKAGRKNSSIQNLEMKKINYKIIDIFPDRDDGFDLADSIIILNKKIKFFKCQVDSQNGEIHYLPYETMIIAKDSDHKEEPKSNLELRIPEHIDAKDYHDNGWYEDKNSMWFRTSTKEDGEFPVKLSNFSMKVLYFVQGSNPHRIIEIINEAKQSAMVMANVEDLIGVAKFNALTEAKGNFLFWGKDAHLRLIKKKLFGKEKTATQIDTLGWQKEGFWAFANGIWNGNFVESDTFGMVTHNGQSYFLPAFSKMAYQEDYANERKFIYQKSNLNFAEWSSLFCEVYKEKNNGRLALLFIISTLFSDIVFSRLRFFPMLNLFGVPGSGKTTLGYSVTYMFGKKTEPVGLGNAGTTKGFVRKFGQVNNGIVWLDEYKNSIGQNKIEALKNLYDRVGYETASKTTDNRTTTKPIKSTAIISGQELPTQDPALFKRVILLQFDKTEFVTAERDIFDKLSRHEELGLSSVLGEILNLRNHFEANFSVKFDEVFAELRQHHKNEDDRMLKNYCILLTTYKVLQNDLSFSFGYQDLFDQIVKLISVQSAAINTVNDTQKFWDMLEYLIASNMVTLDYDYKIIGDQVFLKMSKIYPLYAEHFQRQTGYRGMDKSTLIKYMEMSNAFVKKVDSTRFKDAVTSALVFDKTKLRVNLERVSDIDYDQEKSKEKVIIKKDLADDVPF